MVISGRSDGAAEQISVLINSGDDCRQERDEACILGRVLARIKKVQACICHDGPVVVLSGTVDSLERLLMEQACEMVLVGDLLHDLHCQLVVIDSDICSLKDRGQLVLRRSNLVVLCLGRNAELPELLVEVMHE